MMLHPETALVVCLCLWIPVAKSYAPEDLDGSGDDYEFSSSGSGDGDLWFFPFDTTTQASLNTIKPAWFTDAPAILPEHPVTQLVNPDPEPETPGLNTEAPLQYTTQITETQPSPVIIKSLGSEEDQKGESTTISDVAHPETTIPPTEKLPVVPMREEEYTTTASDDPKESSDIDQEEDETPVLVNAGSVTTEVSDVETTPLLRSTTSASNLPDTEASGDAVESTTVQVKNDFDEKNIIPELAEPNLEKPTMIDDFEFDPEGNEIIKPRAGQDQLGSETHFAGSSASDNDSLLERKEVLAGVIAGGVVGLAFAIMLVALMVYRMKKKDEGSYSLDEHKHPNGGYKKPQKQEEFLA